MRGRETCACVGIERENREKNFASADCGVPMMGLRKNWDCERPLMLCGACYCACADSRGGEKKISGEEWCVLFFSWTGCVMRASCMRTVGALLGVINLFREIGKKTQSGGKILKIGRDLFYVLRELWASLFVGPVIRCFVMCTIYCVYWNLY